MTYCSLDLHHLYSESCLTIMDQSINGSKNLPAADRKLVNELIGAAIVQNLSKSKPHWMKLESVSTNCTIVESMDHFAVLILGCDCDVQYNIYLPKMTKTIFSKKNGYKKEFLLIKYTFHVHIQTPRYLSTKTNKQTKI